MKKSLLFLSAIIFPSLISGCPAPNTNPSPSNYETPAPTATYYPSASASPPPNLSSLQAGVVPDTTLSEQERKLAGLLVRETVPVFPLKIGVFLYRSSTDLDEGARKEYFNNFIENLKKSSNIGQITNISSQLINSNPSLEEIRNLGARFQVSSVLVINERYDTPIESRNSLVTPIDYLTGMRTWESFSNLEVYSLDILNGIFIFSISDSNTSSDKYSLNNSSIENPSLNLMKKSSQKIWENIGPKVISEYDNYKTRLDTKTVLPVIIKTPLPQLAN